MIRTEPVQSKVSTLPFVRLRDVREGDVLVADAGFTCIDAGAELAVARDIREGLYVQCHCGHHLLSGQTDDGIVIGLARKPCGRKAA